MAGQFRVALTGYLIGVAAGFATTVALGLGLPPAGLAAAAAANGLALFVATRWSRFGRPPPSAAV